MSAGDGRVALVTGAGGGIGRAIVLRLARQGCDVGVFDIDADGALGTADLVRGLGRRVAVAVGSVARADDVAAAIAAVVADLGEPDILVNNAGALRTAPFVDTSEAVWRETLGVNLDGVFHLCKAMLPGMLSRHHGAVVNIASWTGKKGVANHAA